MVGLDNHCRSLCQIGSDLASENQPSIVAMANFAKMILVAL